MVQDEFEEIVAAYQLAQVAGEHDALERLSAAYPSHADRLLAFALLDAAVPSAVDAAMLAPLRARITPALRERALAAAFAPTPAAAPIAGILQRGEAVGLNARALAAAVDLPRDLLLQLDRRLIAPASVPRRCLARLAAALQTNVDAVQAFLGGGAVARVAAYNFAPAAPTAGPQQRFADALAESALATPEQRAFWREALREEALEG